MRIVYLDLDTLRPDHMSAYGYPRTTTPNLDRIAAEGVRFSGAYASSTPCVPSRASLISGRFGVNHGVLTHWGAGADFRFPAEDGEYRSDAPLLTRWLRQNGYRTVSFSSFVDRHQAGWFAGGWSEVHSFTLKRGLETAEEVNAAALPWIRAHGHEDDYFLHLHYWDAHRPFRMPLEWAERFADDPAPPWPDEEAIAGHQGNPGPYTAQQLFPFREDSPVPTMPDRIANRDDFVRLVDGYDGGIRYMDHHIGQVFEALDEHGVLEETAIIISSDHGEALGEHGVYADHVCAGEEVHRIPMIVRWPGRSAQGLEQTGLLYNVDLPPTLCDLLDLEVPPGWDGISFRSAVEGEDWAGRAHLVWDHGLYSCQRAVRTRDRLYLRTFHPGLFPFPRHQLYEIASDPHATRDLAAERPGDVAELELLMQDWLQDQLSAPGHPGDPLPRIAREGPWRYVRLEPWLAHLRETGKQAGATEILDRLGIE
jgi:arylsulfatase A-like enzyme